MKYLLEVENLTVEVAGKHLLDQVSFKVPKGTITALVGASGSGKTTIASSILRLLPSALKLSSGQILFDKKNLLHLDPEAMRQMRGNHIAMIFQEPLGAFNPLITIGDQLEEVLMVHTKADAEQRRGIILETLTKVRLSNPLEIVDRYPHQLSGGQRQRAMIAQALLTKPELIIADEPTSNLDVTLQAQIMDLFRHFKRDGVTMLLISHDLGMVSHLADDVVILNQGKVVEAGLTASIMKNPKHPYTKALMEAFA